jgi:hypothetical protein
MAKKLKWKKIGSHKGVVVSSKIHADGTTIFKVVHPTGNTYLIKYPLDLLNSRDLKRQQEIDEALNNVSPGWDIDNG